MYRLTITLLLLAIAQASMAATVTARVSANILEPVKISLATPANRQDFGGIDQQQGLSVQSARNLHFELTHNSRDVCLFQANGGKPEKAQYASCETYTVNFN